jgi:hypothetical protein
MALDHATTYTHTHKQKNASFTSEREEALVVRHAQTTIPTTSSQAITVQRAKQQKANPANIHTNGWRSKDTMMHGDDEQKQKNCRFCGSNTVPPEIA